MLGEKQMYTFENFDISSMKKNIEKQTDEIRSKNFFTLNEESVATQKVEIFDRHALTLFIANIIDCFTRHMRVASY